MVWQISGKKECRAISIFKNKEKCRMSWSRNDIVGLTFRLRSTSWKLLPWINENVENGPVLSGAEVAETTSVMSFEWVIVKKSGCVMGTDSGRWAEPKRHSAGYSIIPHSSQDFAHADLKQKKANNSTPLTVAILETDLEVIGLCPYGACGLILDLCYRPWAPTGLWYHTPWRKNKNPVISEA